MTELKKYNFIHSEQEIKNFFRKVSEPWSKIYKNERSYITLAARSKYLTEEQKKKINLNQTMMIERQILTYSSKKYLYHRDRYEILPTQLPNQEAKKDFINFKLKDDILDKLIETVQIWERKSDLYGAPRRDDSTFYDSIPENAFVIYFYVNPIDLHKFYNIFTGTTLNDLHSNLLEMVSNIESGVHDEHILDIYQRLAKLDYFVKVNYSQAIKSNYWKDIDIDFIDKETKSIFDSKTFLQSFIETLIKKIQEKHKETIEEITLRSMLKQSLYLIESRSGFHLGFQSKLLNQIKAGPEKIIEIIKDICSQLNYSDHIKEIIENKNLQVPLPGTYQGAHKVKLLF